MNYEMCLNCDLKTTFSPRGNETPVEMEQPCMVKRVIIMTILTAQGCAISRRGLVPANIKHVYNIYTTSAQRLRRWADVA